MKTRLTWGAPLLALVVLLSGLFSTVPSARAVPPNRYVSDHMAAAQAVQLRYGVPASVAMAQSILESGWGDSGLTTKYHNFFGIKCTAGYTSPFQSGCISLSSGEWYSNEGWVNQVSAFRTYASDVDSFADYGRFLVENTRYANAFNFTHDPDRFILEVWRAGYATDPDYVGKVVRLMDANNLRSLDLDESTPDIVDVLPPQPEPAPEPAPVPAPAPAEPTTAPTTAAPTATAPTAPSTTASTTAPVTMAPKPTASATSTAPASSASSRPTATASAVRPSSPASSVSYRPTATASSPAASAPSTSAPSTPAPTTPTPGGDAARPGTPTTPSATPTPAADAARPGAPDSSESPTPDPATPSTDAPDVTSPPAGTPEPAADDEQPLGQDPNVDSQSGQMPLDEIPTDPELIAALLPDLREPGLLGPEADNLLPALGPNVATVEVPLPQTGHASGHHAPRPALPRYSGFALPI